VPNRSGKAPKAAVRSNSGHSKEPTVGAAVLRSGRRKEPKAVAAAQSLAAQPSSLDVVPVREGERITPSSV
jgi:hypothetical protein